MGALSSVMSIFEVSGCLTINMPDANDDADALFCG
jgi:hypothetical protein